MNVNTIYENSSRSEQIQDNMKSRDVTLATDFISKESQAEPAATKSSISKPDMTGFETDQITYNNKFQVPEDSKKQEELETVSEEDQLDKNQSRMTDEDYKKISEEGISLEKYNLERLDRALTRIKSQRAVKTESLEVQKEQIQENNEAVRNMAGGNGTKGDIIRRLEDADLPVTEANIAKVANAVELAAVAIQLPDSAMNYMIKNQMEPTIQNMYKALHSGNYSQPAGCRNEAWDAIQGQVTDIITDSGLDNTNENLDMARWLFDHQLPVTENNLLAVRDLNQIKQETAIKDVMEKAVNALAQGKAPESADLRSAPIELVANQVATFQSISDNAIQEATEGKSEEFISKIKLQDLVKAQIAIEQKEIEKNKAVQKGSVQKGSVQKEAVQKETESSSTQQKSNDSKLDIGTITVRRQMEEIRLRMTLDAGQLLSQKGFKLDTDSLSKLIDGLKQLENEYYENLLKEGNVSVSQDNVEILKGSLTGVEQLKTMPSYILGSTLSGRNTETINSLVEEGQTVKATLENAKTAYEPLMTAPRADMGDSIGKAFRNVDTILESMNLETTQANQRAVRILGYNQMDITQENIQNVKSYDQQVNNLMKNLHPAVTVELIKEGIDPLNIPIEQLNQQIQEIKNKLGISKEEKYSNYLWKLEKQQGITEEEKKAYIGIYRLLNAVDKTDGAALGSVVKASQEVTMSNLLTAVRTIKSGGIHADIDDNFGTLQEYSLKNDQITQQIQQGFQKYNLTAGNEATTEGTATGNLATGNLATGNLATGDSATVNSATVNSISAGNISLQDSSPDSIMYINNLVENIMEEISPDKLKSMGSSLEEILGMSMESLYENLEQTPANPELEKEYWTELTNRYQETAKDSADALNLLKDFHLPDNLQNIQAAKDMLSIDSSVFHQLKRLSGKQNTYSSSSENSLFDKTAESSPFIESMDSLETMESAYKDMELEVNRLKDQIFGSDTITSQDLADINRIGNGLTFVQMMAGRETFEIPIYAGETVTNVNVTIIRNGDETGKVKISASSEKLGRLTIDLSVKKNSLKGLILSDNRSGLDTLKAARDEFTGIVEEMGIEVNQMNYGLDVKLNRPYITIPRTAGKQGAAGEQGAEGEKVEKEQNSSSVSTETLYNLAKTMLTQINYIERRSTNEN